MAFGFKATEFLVTQYRDTAAFGRFESILLSTSNLFEIGGEFPDFTLVEAESRDSAQLSVILPSGGVILYMPSDYLWLDLNLDMLSKAIPASKSIRDQSVIIITSGAEVSAFIARVRAYGISLDIHEEFTAVLRDVCNVPNEPVYFCLDDQFRLRKAGVLGASPKAFERALE